MCSSRVCVTYCTIWRRKSTECRCDVSIDVRWWCCLLFARICRNGLITRPARTVMPCTTHVLLAAKKRHGRPNGKKVEKIDARQTRGPNFASAMETTLPDSPEAYCPLRLTLCVQQMWERGRPEAAQRPATREVEIQRWKTNSDRSLACPSSVSGPVVRFVIPRGMFFPSFD